MAPRYLDNGLAAGHILGKVAIVVGSLLTVSETADMILVCWSLI